MVLQLGCSSEAQKMMFGEEAKKGRITNITNLHEFLEIEEKVSQQRVVFLLKKVLGRYHNRHHILHHISLHKLKGCGKC